MPVIGAFAILIPAFAWLVIEPPGRWLWRGWLILGGLAGGLYVWSQVPRGTLRAPLVEWEVVTGIACALAVLGLYLTVVRSRGKAATIAIVQLALMPLLVCCLRELKELGDDPGSGFEYSTTWDLSGRLEDIQPLPPSVVVASEDCQTPSVHGACDQSFLLRATDGVSREQLYQRIADHYAKQGWPLRSTPAGYYGCRTVQGIFKWADLCLEIQRGGYLGRQRDTGIKDPLDIIRVYVIPPGA